MVQDLKFNHRFRYGDGPFLLTHRCIVGIKVTAEVVLAVGEITSHEILRLLRIRVT